MSAHSSNSPVAVQQCMDAACRAEFPVGSILTACPTCAAAGRGESLLDIVYDWNGLREARPINIERLFGPETAFHGSGVWSFFDLLPFAGARDACVSVGEGRTILQRADDLGRHLGFRGRGASGEPSLFLQYEGMNPSGSFKDNGMAAGFTHAKMVGAKVVACASTGNTSASLAMYAQRAGMRAFVFIGDGKIAFGKLSQALDYGATTLQVAGDFDACLARVREIASDPARGVYLLNSVNPFRLEGQKTIMYRVLRDLNLGTATLRVATETHPTRSVGVPIPVPDWIVVPGGNLGNCSAFAKAFIELHALGAIDRVPRLAVINAHGARTLDRMVNELGVRWTPGAPLAHARASLGGSFDRAAVDAEFARMDAAKERAHTIASAIEINRPVNLPKALRALHAMNGVARSVSDDDILEHKAMVGRFGCGCEPASAASVAGAAKLLKEGVIRPDETVVCILTGHQLKDPDATVTYHTGIDTKAAQSDIGPQHRHEPQGRLANRPIRVADDLDAILKAMDLA
jgi:threonine synthase